MQCGHALVPEGEHAGLLRIVCKEGVGAEVSGTTRRVMRGRGDKGADLKSDDDQFIRALETR